MQKIYNSAAILYVTLCGLTFAAWWQYWNNNPVWHGALLYLVVSIAVSAVLAMALKRVLMPVAAISNEKLYFIDRWWSLAHPFDTGVALSDISCVAIGTIARLKSYTGDAALADAIKSAITSMHSEMNVRAPGGMIASLALSSNRVASGVGAAAAYAARDLDTAVVLVQKDGTSLYKHLSVDTNAEYNLVKALRSHNVAVTDLTGVKKKRSPMLLVVGTIAGGLACFVILMAFIAFL